MLLSFSCERLVSPPLPPGIPEGSKKKRTGLWTYTSLAGEYSIYYETGSLLTRGRYVQGQKQGRWTTFTDNGKRIASTGNYLNDWRDGIWEYYDTDNNLYLIVNYAQSPKRDFFITKDYGNENGVYKRYFPDGSLEELGYFKGGFNEGTIIRYYKNKKTALKGQYHKDLMDGQWVYYYPEGHIEREENYKMGKKHGIFRNYHPDGMLYHETTYKEDIETGPRILQRNKTKFKISR